MISKKNIIACLALFLPSFLIYFIAELMSYQINADVAQIGAIRNFSGFFLYFSVIYLILGIIRGRYLLFRIRELKIKRLIQFWLINTTVCIFFTVFIYFYVSGFIDFIAKPHDINSVFNMLGLLFIEFLSGIFSHYGIAAYGATAISIILIYLVQKKER